MATQPPVGPGTLITVKVGIEGSNRKFKIPLADLGPHVLPQKVSFTPLTRSRVMRPLSRRPRHRRHRLLTASQLTSSLKQLRSLLDIPDNQSVVFERYSDSAASYITLDPANATVFKTLARAAKAKLKLRLRATIHSATETDRGTASAQMDLPPVPTLAFQQMGMPMMHPAAQTSQTTLVNVPGVIPPRANPVPFRGQNIPTTRRSPRLSRNAFFDELANISRQRELSLRPRAPADVQIPLPPPAVSWSVYCNLCEKPMAGEHYHCNTCDDGDFDLCQPCVDRGRHCNGVDHWLIKRTLKDGQVVNSTTEKIATKPTPAPKEIIPQPSILRDIIPQEMPGAYTEDVKYDQDEQIEEATRTCNSCINGLFPALCSQKSLSLTQTSQFSQSINSSRASTVRTTISACHATRATNMAITLAIPSRLSTSGPRWDPWLSSCVHLAATCATPLSATAVTSQSSASATSA